MDGDSLGVLKFVRSQVTKMSLILNPSLVESVSNNWVEIPCAFAWNSLPRFRISLDKGYKVRRAGKVLDFHHLDLDA